MNTLRPLLLLAVFLVALPGAVGAREVHLKKGEVYQDRDLSVICEGAAPISRGGTPVQPLSVKECQYWNDFAKKCLSEKITYTHNNVECVEECQHWDAFSNTCDYMSKCTFYPQQEAFVLTTCAEFDDFNHKCLQVKEEKLGTGN